MSKTVDLNDRQDLKAKLDKAVAELKTQCKDAHFFDTQMDRILSLKGQIDVEPVRLIVKEADVLKEYKGDTFWMAVTKQGAIFHTYGGYTVVADNRNASALYTVMSEMVDLLNTNEEADEMVIADLQCKMHLLAMPTWCFTDADATYNIASAVVGELTRLSERLTDEPLQEEDVQANAEFEDAVRGMNEIGKRIEEEKGDD